MIRSEYARLLMVASAGIGCAVVCGTEVALAHPGHGGHGFGDGFTHPLLGLDHLLAMFAVGLLGARLGGRMLWALPGVFLGCMALGWGAALAGVPLPGVELGILASVIALGGLIALSFRLPAWAVLALTGGFALFHGAAHGAEMGNIGSTAEFAAGMLLGTAALHAAGLLGGLVLARIAREPAIRLSGAAIAAAGLLLLAGVL